MSSSIPAPGIDERLRILRTIWAAFLASVFLYAVVGYVVSPPAFTWRALGHAGEDGSWGLGLTAAALYAVGLLTSVLFSQLLLRSFLRRAEAEQNPALVQTGLILAFAVCESGALMGLVILFLTQGWTAFILMGISAMVLAVLRPRREQLVAASYKKDSAL